MEVVEKATKVLKRNPNIDLIHLNGESFIKGVQQNVPRSKGTVAPFKPPKKSDSVTVTYDAPVDDSQNEEYTVEVLK